jgi:hypothetical protein
MASDSQAERKHEICGVLPTPETVSRDCMRAKQSEIELFSANARQEV